MQCLVKICMRPEDFVHKEIKISTTWLCDMIKLPKPWGYKRLSISPPLPQMSRQTDRAHIKVPLQSLSRGQIYEKGAIENPKYPDE